MVHIRTSAVKPSSWSAHLGTSDLRTNWLDLVLSKSSVGVGTKERYGNLSQHDFLYNRWLSAHKPTQPSLKVSIPRDQYLFTYYGQQGSHFMGQHHCLRISQIPAISSRYLPPPCSHTSFGAASKRFSLDSYAQLRAPPYPLVPRVRHFYLSQNCWHQLEAKIDRKYNCLLFTYVIHRVRTFNGNQPRASDSFGVSYKLLWARDRELLK